VLGKPAIGQRVWDILRVLDYLATRPDVDASQIRVLGRGSAGNAGGMAALLDERVRSILLTQAIPSYQSIVDSEDYSVTLDWFVPGILQHFDLPDILASLSPRPVWIYNAVDADGKPLSKAAARDCYLQRVPENSPAFSTLRFGDGPKNEAELYSNWLQNA
jgi:hypothetical protein